MSYKKVQPNTPLFDNLWKLQQFTIIDHDQREKYKLNIREYILVDKIDYLSKGKKAVVRGWCYAPGYANGLPGASVF